jgi:hypothetical protein
LPSASRSDCGLTFTVRSPAAIELAAPTMRLSAATIACIASSSWPASSRESTSIRACRSPSATCCATFTASASGSVMLRVITKPAAIVRPSAASTTTTIDCSVRRTFCTSCGSSSCIAFECWFASS